jgi:hypothetical protein
MVNQKRVERKLPLLITDGPWWSPELDRNEYRLKQFKKKEPLRYQIHRDVLLTELDKLKRDVDRFLEQNRK